MRARDATDAEIAVAEAWAAGAAGVVEDEDGCLLTIYVTAAAADAVGRALRAALPSLEIAPAELVASIAWGEAWKHVLQPVEISRRLVVAPSFATPAPRPGQHWIRIEPGQAFGTGAHHSTRLALEGIDAAVCRARPRSVLDVGTGSGVLALAALALGAGWAVGFDLDPLAAPAARRAAGENGLDDRAAWFTGPIEALGPGRFELVAANLLRGELLPIASEIARRLAPGGSLVLAGLLEADAPGVRAAFAALGLRQVALSARRDDDGESWIGLVLRRA